MDDPEELSEIYAELARKCMILYKCDDPDEAMEIFVKNLEETAEYAMKRYGLPSGEALKRFHEEMRDNMEAILNLEEENEDLKMLASLFKPRMGFMA